MDNTLIAPQNQPITPDTYEAFSNYFSMLKEGGLLNKSGITKTKGAFLQGL
jgi:hypothetical protein